MDYRHPLDKKHGSKDAYAYLSLHVSDSGVGLARVRMKRYMCTDRASAP